MTVVDLNMLLKWIKKNDFTDVLWTDFEGKDHYCNMDSIIEFLNDFIKYLYQHPEHRDYFLYGG